MYATAFLLRVSALRDSFRGRAALQLELIALRHQLPTMKRTLAAAFAAADQSPALGAPIPSKLAVVGRTFERNDNTCLASDTGNVM